MNKFGLVLGAGGPKGFAHIGVIEALREHQIIPSCVVGCSVGSFVGVLYAWDDRAMSRIAREIQPKELLKRSYFFRDGGRYKSEAISEYIEGKLMGRTLNQLRTPVAVMTTDLVMGDGVLMDSGPCGLAVAASCAVPGLFSPVSINGGVFRDGGVACPLPIDECRTMFGVEYIIAVDISAFKSVRPPVHIWTDLDRSLSIMYHTSIATEIKRQSPDNTVVLYPDASFMSYDLKERDRAIEVGREATIARIDDIKKMLDIKKIMED